MNKEELIEVLRQFDEKRVEELPEKTRNIFYAIMKIADERDELERKRIEALEYIEGFYYPDERQLTHEFDGWNLAKLYDILNKGDNNE
jgi:hypothetical protein